MGLLKRNVYQNNTLGNWIKLPLLQTFFLKEERKNNKCCQQNCKFQRHAICKTGRCCTNCIYSKPGTLCRPVRNVCDLLEYCFGTTNQCPADFYMQDGMPCTEEGYCYHGNCTDCTMHCREIFGRYVYDGNNECYTINSRGRQFEDNFLFKIKWIRNFLGGPMSKTMSFHCGEYRFDS